MYGALVKVMRLDEAVGTSVHSPGCDVSQNAALTISVTCIGPVSTMFLIKTGGELDE